MRSWVTGRGPRHSARGDVGLRAGEAARRNPANESPSSPMIPSALPGSGSDEPLLRRVGIAAWLSLMALVPAAVAEQRFPPPEFETGHKLPETTVPPPRVLALEYLDVAVLLGALALATWLVHRRRSRRGVMWLSLASLAYFGFYKQGCVCAIGSVQNLALSLCDRSYALPWTVFVFFLAPVAVALFFGRTFCAGVCPHGALQDLVLVKPLKVPTWLEQGLGTIPFLFLGAGAIFAATGSGFVICRYDPFVPLFRVSGSAGLVTLGAAFLVVGLVIGRPYCRFFCPYGALLRLAALAAKWRIRVTPTVCTQCQLCAQACPYGAMREPTPTGALPGEKPAGERRRLSWLLLALPLLVAGGALLGAKLAPAAAQLHPAVQLAERWAANEQQPANYPLMTPEALSLERAAADPEAALANARTVRERLTLACWLLGGWAGLVIGLKLIVLSVRVTRTDFEPDRGACVACARCFLACPNERVRVGLPLEPGTPAGAVAPSPPPPGALASARVAGAPSSPPAPGAPPA